MEKGKRQKLVQPLFYQSDTNIKAVVTMSCFKFNGIDSVLVYQKWNEPIKLKKGARKVDLTYTDADTNSYLLPAFSDVIRKVNIVPPGLYKFYVTIAIKDSLFQYSVQRNVDSSLSQRSALNKMVGGTLQSKAKKRIPVKLNGGNNRSKNAAVNKLSLARSQRKLDRLLKKDHIRSVAFEKDGAQNVDLFYGEWFIGRYSEKKGDADDARQILKADNSLEDYKSLFSQTREIKKEKKEKKRVEGQVTLSTNLSTGQEEYSETDNNFYEVGGLIGLPIGNFPIAVEGLYTSQDRYRKIKTSFITLRYDVDKAKEELLGSVQAYKQKFSETQTKGRGIQNIYSAYLGQLLSKKQQLLRDMKQKPAVEANDSIVGKYGDAQSKLAELKETERKIEKYQALLDQYKNTLYFDSVMAYDKVKDLESAEGLTYKQLSKKAGGFLPEGKGRKFLAGITGFQAGIFPKYISKYTASGQTVKGIDLGYDFGFFQAVAENWLLLKSP